MDFKRIAVLGCGSMGMIIGAYLNKNGCPADLIDSYKEHVDALNKNGAHVVERVDFTVPVHALLPEEMEGIYDLVFLMTKQTANKAVIENLLPHLGPDSVVCTLQNGVPEPFVDRLVGGNRTVGGTILWGATFVGPGVSAQTMDFNPGQLLFDIGEIDGSLTERIEAVHQVLEHMGPTRVMTNLMDARWAKLVANACGSGLSSACGVPFSYVTEDERGMEYLLRMSYEVGQCCRAEGHVIEGHWENWDREVPGNLELNRKAFYDNYARQKTAKASMLQDLEKGRETEVRMINGYVCEIGRKHGIPTPCNDAVVEIIEAIGRGELPLNMSNLDKMPPL